MRPSLLIAAAALAGAAPALALAASDQTVQARDSYFSPRSVTLEPGDTLTIEHVGPGAHGLRFDDELHPRESGGTGWTQTRTFTAAQVRSEPYGLVCTLHPAMTGEVTVRAAGTTPTPTPTATATPTPGPTATPTPTPTGGTAPPPRLRSVRTTAATFCARRGTRCARPGVRLRIDLTAPARVTGTLTRRVRRGTPFRRFGTLDFGHVAAGPRTLAFTRTRAGRRLARGRYRLALAAAGSTRTLAFAVR